ncbi:MAG: MEDS domain-containing protein [Candidatus Omnitrophota bacterium]
MDTQVRKSGLKLIRDFPWGTHFCQFYSTKQDLLDILVPYFKAGLKNNEFCMWVTSEPLGVTDAKAAMQKAVPDFKRYIKKGQIEIIAYSQWYVKGGAFNQDRVLDGWVRKLKEGERRGFDGLRLTGNTLWLEKKHWKAFTEYERVINSVIGNYKMLAICTYSLDKCGASEILDVVANHEFALVKRNGKWQILESSERKRIENLLQEKISHLASFPQLNPNPVIEVDASGKVIFCNYAAIRILQRLNAPKRINLFFPADFAKILKAAQSGEKNEFNREVKIKDSIFIENLAIVPESKTVRIYALDITWRKRAEEALRKSEGQLKKLNRMLKALSDSDQAMMRADNEADYLNKICEIIIEDCGYSMVWIGFAEEDEDRTVRPVAQAGFEEGYLKTVNITWSDTEFGRGPTGTAIRTGKPSICRNMLTDTNFKPWRQEAIKRGYASSIVLPLITADRVFGAINIYSREPDPFSEKEVQLLSELADDLAYGIQAIRLRAEHAQAEEELHRADEILKRDKETLERIVKERTEKLLAAELELEKAKHLSDIGTLAATVAHELRNPLAAIGIAAHNIKRKAKNPDLEHHLSNIEKKVSESDQIINNLLYYSRIKPPHYERINIRDIINECVDTKKKGFHNKISCKVRMRVPDIFIEADPLQMKEVFSNIINNACDAISGERGKVEIAIHDETNSVRIDICDNGCGIEKEYLSKVFDPFFTTKAKGTGLGLSVCQQIVHLHGGSISIESQPQKGTTVTVSLPKKE